MPDFDVFLSFTWSDVDAVEPIEKALRDNGLRVFRDSECIAEFDGITEELVRGLASAKVLLAYYSKRYPTRPACQWELTSAIIAAQRDGDPRRRVLVVNPEPNSDHIAPVFLEDARYFETPASPADRTRLAQRVRAKVDAVSGPLGRTEPVEQPTRTARPVDFVGRFPQLWRIHSILHAEDYPATARAERCAAAMITGVGGIGKTSLAEQYALVFRDAFPAGTYWVGPLTGDSSEVVAQFQHRLRELAETELGLRVDGVEPARLRALVAARFRRPALVVVDGVPAGLPAEVLDRLLIPSRWVRTVLTSRGGDWPVPVVELAGLDRLEGRTLFARVGRPAEWDAVDALTERCGGHPMVLALTAKTLRTNDDLDRAAATVGALVAGDVAGRGDTARLILRLASVLAHARIPVRLIMAATGLSEMDSGAALIELTGAGLARRLDADGWIVHPLVSDAVRRQADPVQLTALARSAAIAVLAVLEKDGFAPLRQHLGALAGQGDLGTALRVELLRAAARGHEALGELERAGQRYNELLGLGTDDPADPMAAAEVTLTLGKYQEAHLHSGQAMVLAENRGDEQARFLATLQAARALDHLAEYRRAEDTFWSSILDSGAWPEWLTEEQRSRAETARAIGLRLRGRPRDALAVLESICGQVPAEPLADRATVATLELARAQLLTGHARAARRTAGELAAAYQEAGLEQHPRRLEALGVLAEATLAQDFGELRAKRADWEASERKLRALYLEYRERFGATNPLTLTVAVQRDRALVALGRPADALAALSATERVVIEHLGEHHPLRYRIRQAMGLSYGQLRKFQDARGILSDVLPRQRATLGETHVDTLETKLDLGIATALTDDADAGRKLIDEAAAHLREVVGLRPDLEMRATTAQLMFRIVPERLLGLVTFIDRLFSGKKTN